MADRDERALVAAEPAFEPVDRGEVEVVGRLVEQQQVGLWRQRAGERGPPPLAAAGAVAGRAMSMPSWPAIASTSCRGGASAPRQREIHQRRVAGEVGSCSSSTILVPGWIERLPLSASIWLGDQPEQRGLARAVAADQRQPVARADVQVEVAEQPARRPAAGRGLPSERIGASAMARRRLGGSRSTPASGSRAVQAARKRAGREHSRATNQRGLSRCSVTRLPSARRCHAAPAPATAAEDPDRGARTRWSS